MPIVPKVSQMKAVYSHDSLIIADMVVVLVVGVDCVHNRSKRAKLKLKTGCGYTWDFFNETVEVIGIKRDLYPFNEAAQTCTSSSTA